MSPLAAYLTTRYIGSLDHYIGQNVVQMLKSLAPTEHGLSDYDRRHLALYAALLDAADAGLDWRNVATSLMNLNDTDVMAETCWRSHLERARWIVGDGLPEALSAFGRSE